MSSSYSTSNRRKSTTTVFDDDHNYMPSTIRCGFWNILSSRMVKNEFLTTWKELNEEDDVKNWEGKAQRGDKVMTIILNMIEKGGVGVIGLVENDQPGFIRDKLPKHWAALHVIDKEDPFQTNSFKLCPGDKLISIYDTKTGNLAQNVKEKLQQCEDDGLSLLYDTQRYDCIGFYVRDGSNTEWSLQKVEKASAIFDKMRVYSSDDKKTKTKDRSDYFLAPHRMFVWRMKDKQNNMEFNVMVSHLSSGELEKDAIARAKDLDNILSFISNNQSSREKTVILQDSNFSKYYGYGANGKENLEHQDTKNQKFVEKYFTDGVLEGNECFKMRGTEGKQAAKFCNLMFDQIDRILIPKAAGTCFGVDKNFGFTKYNNEKENKEMIEKIRIHKRQDLKTQCVKDGWNLLTKANIAKDMEYLLELYPNESAPSDHPPVAADITFNQLGKIDEQKEIYADLSYDLLDKPTKNTINLATAIAQKIMEEDDDTKIATIPEAWDNPLMYQSKLRNLIEEQLKKLIKDQPKEKTLIK